MFKIRFTKDCIEMLQEITDNSIREKIKETIQDLKENPEEKGKALIGELLGYRSIRSVGQRYRIIYSVDNDKIVVYIVAAGIRKDGDKNNIYNVAIKLKKQYDEQQKINFEKL